MADIYSKPLAYLDKTHGVKYTSPEKSVNPELMIQIKNEGRAAANIAEKLAKELQIEFSNYNVDFSKRWQSSGHLIPYFWIRLQKLGYEDCQNVIGVSFDYFSDELIFYISVDLRELKATNKDRIKQYKLLKNTSLDNDFVYRTVMKTNYGNVSYKSKNLNDIKERLSGDMYPQIAYCLSKEDVDRMSDDELLTLTVKKIKEIEKYYDYVVKD